MFIGIGMGILGGGGSAPVVPSFTPLDVDGMVLWLAADSGTYQDASKTIPAILDGDVIGAWADKSGSGNDVIQSTTAKKPLLKLSTINTTLPTVQYDGSDDRLINASFALAQPMTFIWLEKVNTNSVRVTFDSYNASQVLIYTSGSNTFAFIAGFGTLTNPYNNGYNLHVIILNGASSKYWINDAWKVATTNAGANSISGISLGHSTGNPDPAIPTAGLLGNIAEWMIYDSALDKYKIAQLVLWVNAKYGVGLVSPLIFAGNSMTAVETSTYPATVGTTLGCSVINTGVSSQTTTNMITNDAARIDPMYQPEVKAVVVWEGTNDLVINSLTAAQAYDNLVTYCLARKARGFKIVILTILPRTIAGTPVDFETNRQTINTNIRNNYLTFSDALADVGADATIGEAGDSDNATYYTDKLHMTTAGYDIVAGIVATAVGTLT